MPREADPILSLARVCTIDVRSALIFLAYLVLFVKKSHHNVGNDGLLLTSLVLHRQKIRKINVWGYLISVYACTKSTVLPFILLS